MTNIRFKGFDSATQLREHLADVEEGAPADSLAEDIPGEDELQSALREVAWLRKDVADLREQLALFPGQHKTVAGNRVGAFPWLRMGVAVVTAIVLGRWMLHLRHGPGSPAVSMIPARIHRDHW
ncbi:hypothetical protein EV130_106475 [Rhizobium azibense]|uniref:Uncharacterized protein n=1 Tax=Rhizobium azibense TaxID=1136135 RepID=A0A4R3QWU1_9HYPH|nr:hypothetical protein EV130_106475 [Rhizobium azibense]